MRIAFMTRIPPAHCGIGEYSSMLISELLGLGAGEIVVIGDRGWKNGLPQPYAEPYTGVAVYKCFDAEKPGFYSALNCSEDVGEVDILHIQHEYAIFPSNEEFLRLVRDFRGRAKRVVVTLHTVAHYSRGDRYVEFQRALARLADALIVHSSLQEFELWVQGIRLDNVYKVPHGTLMNPYAGAGKEELLSKLGLEKISDRFLLVVPGFLRRNKGLDLMLDAYEILRGQGRDYALVLQGERQGAESSGYVDSLRKHLQSEGVVFSERYLERKELLMLLAAADVSVFPYPGTSYGVSGALHLALGSGKPVVCTRVPKLVECYERAPRLAVPPGNPELLAGKIAELRRGACAGELEALRSYALETSWRNVAEKHLVIYRGLLGAELKSIAAHPA